MEEALQNEVTAQRIGLQTASPRNHRSDGSKAGHALTFNWTTKRGPTSLSTICGGDDVFARKIAMTGLREITDEMEDETD